MFSLLKGISHRINIVCIVLKLVAVCCADWVPAESLTTCPRENTHAARDRLEPARPRCSVIRKWLPRHLRFASNSAESHLLCFQDISHDSAIDMCFFFSGLPPPPPPFLYIQKLLLTLFLPFYKVFESGTPALKTWRVVISYIFLYMNEL